MQFITGGRALKIVRECSVPVIIAQSRPIRETGYDDIVVPLDLHQTQAKAGHCGRNGDVLQRPGPHHFACNR